MPHLPSEPTRLAAVALADLKPDERSQPILRVPYDKTPAELVLDDGSRSYVMLFVVPGDRVTQLFDDDSRFVPVIVGGTVRMIARCAIACITVGARTATDDHGLPQERQEVLLKLRGGTSIRGELRWTAPVDRLRTLDHLNDELPHLTIWDGTHVHLVAKSTVISVEEV